jgi:predicted MFS family arabinose efflux permease
MKYGKHIDLQNIIRHFQTTALLAAVLLVGANAFILSPILTNVAQNLNTDPARIAWAISAFGAATVISALTLASLIDRLPAGRVLGGAALVLAVAQVLSGMSEGWLWLCLSQSLAGTATGVLLPGTYAITAATAPEGRAAARLGIILTGWALSLVLAVPLAAFVADRFGWRAVYWLLSGLSVVTAAGLMEALRGVHGGTAVRVSLWCALRLRGVAPILAVMFAYMTAFYGSFAFYGEGLRQAFNVSAQGAGLFVLAYGLGFGMAGVGLGIFSPRISRGYILLVLAAIATSYACWGLALTASTVAFGAAVIWGGLNQLGLNALVVSLNQRAQEARGAVMGLNSAVTYSAVFAGPLLMGPINASLGFPNATAMAAIFVLIGLGIGWKRL